MKCPYCGEVESKVLDSRSLDENSCIRRRRECLECHRRFTTYERIEEMPIMVVKRDGSREQFNRAKLLTGLMKSFEKRPVGMEQIETLSAEIEQEIRGRYDREVMSRDIGELIMDKLRAVDEVAYVRFASVYRQFGDLNSFIKTIEQLQHTSRKGVDE
ncbi:MAG: transcriptional regulator NrdR [Methylocystaceae bacterium]